VKPGRGVDDLLLMRNHHWAYDTSTFLTERHWIQFALILLLLSYAGCRPVELVNTKKASATGSDMLTTLTILSIRPRLVLLALTVLTMMTIWTSTLVRAEYL